MIVNFQGFSGELRELKQYLAYEGLLEGLPTVEPNQRCIKRILHDIEEALRRTG